MEAVRPHAHDSNGASSTDDAQVLCALADLLAEAALDDDLPTLVVDRIVDLLGLSGATLSLVRKRDDALHLEALASVGAHAAFARDMSARPLESLADAATAVAEGRPVFVVDEHGGPQSEPTETGVGRWRASISAHATGVLPVRAWGETLGVLTVEWPGSRPLGAEQRALLEAVAAMLGPVLHGLVGRSEGAAKTAPIGRRPDDAVQLAVLGVTPAGVVVPLPDEAGAGLAPALVISRASRHGTGDEAPVWDVVGTGSCSIAAAVGLAATSDGDPGRLAEMAASSLRDYASQGVAPAEALSYLEHAIMAGGTAGARVSVAAFTLTVAGAARVLSLAAAGAVMWVVVSTDGRMSSGVSGRLALSGAGGPAPAGRELLLLPGDRAVLLAGPVGPLDSPAGRDSIKAVAGDRGVTGAQAARSALGLLGDVRRAASAVVIEVRETP